MINLLPMRCLILFSNSPTGTGLCGARESLKDSGASSGKEENLIGTKVKVSYINANDNTVEGLEVIGKPAFSVQYHPEACPGPNDASELFDQFEKLVRSQI